MKKLLFVATAALCATVFGAIESTNVVGYQQVPVTTGFVLFTPTFKGIGVDSMNLSDIKIVKADGSASEVDSTVSVQKMDDTGAYLDSYTYIEGYGWYGAEGGVTIKTGEAICVNNDSGETVYFRVAGQVDLVNKNAVATGFVLWGNSTPVTIDLWDVKIVKADGSASEVDSTVSAQKMDDTGAYLDSYTYIEGYGWFGAEGGVELAPGESCCLNNDSGETVYLKVPSPIK